MKMEAVLYNAAVLKNEAPNQLSEQEDDLPKIL